jgi:hypothetical protein
VHGEPQSQVGLSLPEPLFASRLGSPFKKEGKTMKTDLFSLVMFSSDGTGLIRR